MSVVMSLPVDKILVAEGRRDLDIEAVSRLASSIKEIGLQHPITVRGYQDKFSLVAGRHRLEAMRELGETHILASVSDLDAVDAEMWESQKIFTDPSFRSWSGRSASIVGGC